MSGETVETSKVVTDDTTMQWRTVSTRPDPDGLYPYPGTIHKVTVGPSTKTSYTEKVVNRLNVNELNLVSSHPMYSLLRLRDASTLGAINIIEQRRHLTEAQYERFVDFEWPEGNSETTTNTYQRREEPPPSPTVLPAPGPPRNPNKDNSARPKKKAR